MAGGVAMSAHQTLLAEAVAHGLDEGWWAAKRRAVQPTKALLMECLYQAVMARLEGLVAREGPTHD
jgi:hypothetical protein